MLIRLDKYVSQCTDYSRRDVKRLVKRGAILVDGAAATDAAMHISADQQVSVEDVVIGSIGPRYFMLHKPKGYVCATKDGDHPVVLDLLDEPNKDRLQIAGRLDIDTTGLVLITDDGAWNHAVTSPRRGCEKRYLVYTADDIPDDAARKLAKGVMLHGEKQRTRPALLEQLCADEARLTISEGKYHQVKRMFAALGNHVEELHREAIGPIELDPDLEEGEYRPLTEMEISSVLTEEKN